MDLVDLHTLAERDLFDKDFVHYGKIGYSVGRMWTNYLMYRRIMVVNGPMIPACRIYDSPIFRNL